MRKRLVGLLILGLAIFATTSVRAASFSDKAQGWYAYGCQNDPSGACPEPCGCFSSSTECLNWFWDLNCQEICYRDAHDPTCGDPNHIINEQQLGSQTLKDLARKPKILAFLNV